MAAGSVIYHAINGRYVTDQRRRGPNVDEPWADALPARAGVAVVGAALLAAGYAVARLGGVDVISSRGACPLEAGCLIAMACIDGGAWLLALLRRLNTTQ
jgi:hypothetical protein